MNYDNAQIKKVKLTKNGGLHVEFNLLHSVEGYDDEFIRETVEKSDMGPHPDLRNLFKKLSEHLIRLYGMLGSDSLLPLADWSEHTKSLLAIRKDEVFCTSISLGGSDESEGVVVSGKMRSIGGKFIALNTPFIQFSSTDYPFARDVERLCVQLRKEAIAYIFEDKCAASAQGKLFDGQGNAVDKEEAQGAVEDKFEALRSALQPAGTAQEDKVGPGHYSSLQIAGMTDKELRALCRQEGISVDKSAATVEVRQAIHNALYSQGRIVQAQA